MRRQTVLLLLVTSLSTVAVVLVMWLRFVHHPAELVDLSVDGEIGTKEVSIQQAHVQQLTHRGTWVIIVDAESSSRMLFMRRSASIYTCPSTWSWLGEHTKAGEDYDAAAVRGMMEELHVAREAVVDIHTFGGLELMHLEYHHPYKRIDHQWVKTFVARLPVAAVRPMDDAENGAYRWVPINESEAFISETGRACTDATNIYSVASPLHASQKVHFASLKDLIVSKIHLYQTKHAVGSGGRRMTQQSIGV
jgi:hypothetical protein